MPGLFVMPRSAGTLHGTALTGITVSDRTLKVPGRAVIRPPPYVYDPSDPIVSENTLQRSLLEKPSGVIPTSFRPEGFGIPMDPGQVHAGVTRGVSMPRRQNL